MLRVGKFIDKTKRVSVQLGHSVELQKSQAKWVNTDGYRLIRLTSRLQLGDSEYLCVTQHTMTFAALIPASILANNLSPPPI